MNTAGRVEPLEIMNCDLYIIFMHIFSIAQALP